MKFALVSQALPPSWSGHSVAISRVLKGLDPDDYCLITQDYGQGRAHRQQLEGRLPGRYYYIPQRYAIPKGWRFGLVRSANIRLRARQIARIIRRENCAAVVACPGDFFDLPAAFYASRMVGVKFYPYLLDYYSQQSAGYSSEASARRLEELMMKEATAVIVPNEFMGEEMRQLYGVTSVVLVRNPCDLSAYVGLSARESNGDGTEFKIVYTGSIYNAHYDAFRNLLAAIKMLDKRNVKLHIYTDQSRAVLEKNGIHGPVVLHAPQEASAMPGIQRQADLLFFPLAFDSPFPGLIRTSGPAKTGEYLAAARPVLVHVPPDSFLAWYFRQHDCGLVVDEPDPAELARALEMVLTDPSLRHRLAANAWERAQSDFSIEASQGAFAKLLGLHVPQIEQQRALTEV